MPETLSVGLSTMLRRLDDRVIGRADRDRATRRRAGMWASGALLVIVLVVFAADYISSRHRGVPMAFPGVAAGVVLGGAVGRFWRRSRRDR